MQTAPELDVNHMAGDDTRWPCSPPAERPGPPMKYWKIDPVRAEIVVSMRF